MITEIAAAWKFPFPKVLQNVPLLGVDNHDPLFFSVILRHYMHSDGRASLVTSSFTASTFHLVCRRFLCTYQSLGAVTESLLLLARFLHFSVFPTASKPVSV